MCQNQRQSQAKSHGGRADPASESHVGRAHPAPVASVVTPSPAASKRQGVRIFAPTCPSVSTTAEADGESTDGESTDGESDEGDRGDPYNLQDELEESFVKSGGGPQTLIDSVLAASRGGVRAEGGSIVSVEVGGQLNLFRKRKDW